MLFDKIRNRVIKTYNKDHNYIQQAKEVVKISLEEHGLGGCSDDLINFYTLLVLTEGSWTALTDEDIHDAWSVWQNISNPDHKSIVRFKYLEPDIKKLDAPYTNALNDAASILFGGEVW